MSIINYIPAPIFLDNRENRSHSVCKLTGYLAGTMTSTNTHTISVFQKGIRFTKVDKTIATLAVFDVDSFEKTKEALNG